MTSPDAIPQEVRDIAALIEGAGYEAFIVGGAVRDLLIGDEPEDYDIATSAVPEHTVDILEKSKIGHYDTGIKHGTVTASAHRADGQGIRAIEITSYRADGQYLDSRHPKEVRYGVSMGEDVRRRDFTINALYMRGDGTVVDEVGGLADLEARIIRTVGNPEQRFDEDPLRIMRALRFSAQLGFEIEEETFDAMTKLRMRLNDISGERIEAELVKLLTAPFAGRAVRRGAYIMSAFIPALEKCIGFDQHSRYHDLDVLEHTIAVIENLPRTEEGRAVRDPVLAVSALFHDIAKPICFRVNANGVAHMKGHPVKGSVIANDVLTRLHCPHEFTREVTELVLLHDTFTSTDRVSVHKFLCGHSEEFYVKLAALQRADILAHSELGRKRISRLEKLVAVSKELRAEGCAFDVKELAIGGGDVIELGVPEGPEVGKVMGELFERHIEDKVINKREELLAEASKIVRGC